MNSELLIEDYLGKGPSLPIDNLAKYTANGQPLHVAINSGLVFVKERRSEQEIAQDWATSVFGEKFNEKMYSATNPFMRARHYHVADFLNDIADLKNKSIVDIGAGEGSFLQMTRKHFGAKPFGVELSKENTATLSKLDIPNFTGTVEEYAKKCDKPQQYDCATMIWTLCNVGNCLKAIKDASKLLKPNGLLMIAESSRILVPFKKPIHKMFSKHFLPDLHPWYFSHNSICNLLKICGFEIEKTNFYLDQNDLFVVGRKTDQQNEDFAIDSYLKVLDFFRRWEQESIHYID